MSPRPKRRKASRRAAHVPRLPDPRSGKPIVVADRRAEFERRSRRTPRDPEAERAFLEGKIDLIRSDPRLSEGEKEREIAKLRRYGRASTKDAG